MKHPQNKKADETSPNAQKRLPPRRDAADSITSPTNPGKHRDLKDIFVTKVGATVIAGQMQPFIGRSSNEDGELRRRAAEHFVGGIKDTVQPRDALEEMLVVQMAWTHARLARLSAIANDQTATTNVRVLNDACDRAAGTFRRQMLALAEYRRPPRTENFVAIKQANVAAQQVVQNVQNQNSNLQNPVASNEQGLSPAALPPVAHRPEIPTRNGQAKQAVADEHRPSDGDGQGPLQDECDQARRAQL